MNQFFPIFLLDMDGVLVEPHGYRLAIQATLNHFTQRMGFSDLYPGEDAIARLESINVTSEWDITPILLAAILNLAVAEDRSIVSDLPATLDEACKWIHDKALPSPDLAILQQEIDYLVDLLGPAFQPGMVYSELALKLNQSGGEHLPYPHLAGHPLLEDILGNTRSLTAAPVTRIFQHFTLGSGLHERIFGGPRLVDVPSYLQTYDHLLILPQTRDRLMDAWLARTLGLAAYTARPSMPALPRVNGQAALRYQYSPEAELVLESAGLESIPLIGLGQVCWLAAELDKPEDGFVKPSPVQALSAIAAAVTRDPAASLRAAARLDAFDEPGLFADLPPLSIHVFEDSGGNVRAVRKAGEMLNRAGCTIRVSAWGIAENSAKRDALRQAGAHLVSDVNAAVQQAFAAETL